MGFLSKLFGNKTSVESLQRAVEQKRYADAVYLADELNNQPLDQESSKLVAQWRATAGDGLARLNLLEGRVKQDSGKLDEANDYFALALQFACSDDVKEEIAQARQLPFEVISTRAPDPGAGCSTCGSADAAHSDRDALADVDDAIHFDLILTSYPENQRERYHHRGKDFVDAFLLAHGGNDVQANELFNNVKETDRDDLYWFEVGALQARMGHLTQAKSSLEQSLQQNPELFLAVEALVQVLLALGQADAARTFVEGKIPAENEDDFSPYHALLVTIHSQRHDWPAAVVHVRHCLQRGYSDPAFIALAAGVMEKVGDIAEAEGLLKRLPSGGGCKSNQINLTLAEFYLRHERELEKVFSSFNAAVKQDPDNPRWRLRLAQACFARKWHKDGLQLLQQLADAPALPAEMEAEVKQLLAHYGNSPQ
ncbi:tetratricopeptide repeat protein [Pelovirga terrestris]|uniref:Tetratricopeptide repeat protein n=1 Tax=Pelovirga terrestris TaxID=2771352 RepID=A0A8J6R5R5_9BACT|nr:tetratricopeptide repeat protein [Pelovirga terrestris]MBD1400554.1 tetratricopeptide repeat protein [Pelovirga terrestris]